MYKKVLVLIYMCDESGFVDEWWRLCGDGVVMYGVVVVGIVVVVVWFIHGCSDDMVVKVWCCMVCKYDI